MENEEWKILTIGAETIANTYPCCPDDKYIRIKYTVRLKRRTFYYFFNLLVPCGLIGFLAVLGFTLPPDSGEKLSLGATLLFSLIVFLNMIGDSMPANSDAIPLLGTYFNCVMVTIALSVVSTIVINLNLNAMHVKEVQGRSKKVFLVWLPWILRMNSPPCLVSQQDKSKKKVGDHANTSHLSHSENACSLPSQQWKFIAIS
ncbi:Acetylcholine receptor subunit alpha-type acr-16 [Pseudolycoriella hygida]|uniref:Acetylcholine receptor subunit alpha-type acr-16 n=1 Tax=Pseudolycoriella hygida TaxID=35572 RepID=A0A9Q0MQ57_9DIPT|nr:Acetylcholine receptor subunit alpha-type acr-16 [Pseudolycoriella hygida]